MTEGARYVINEWLWADLSRQNGPENRTEALRFLEVLLTRPDRVIIVIGSAFDEKAWRMCKSGDLVLRELGKFFVRGIRQDQLKCQLLRQEELSSLPGSLATMVKPDDQYLVQAALAVPCSVIITGDRPLKKVLDDAGIPCELRDRFLQTFLGG